MNKINKVVLWLSFAFCIICLVASVWMSVVLRDGMSYAITVLFFLATVWLGINLRRANNNDTE